MRNFLSPLPVRERMKVRVRTQRPARFRIPPLLRSLRVLGLGLNELARFLLVSF
jgi:hypothetical protein